MQCKGALRSVVSTAWLKAQTQQQQQQEATILPDRKIESVSGKREKRRKNRGYGGGKKRQRIDVSSTVNPSALVMHKGDEECLASHVPQSIDLFQETVWSMLTYESHLVRERPTHFGCYQIPSMLTLNPISFNSVQYYGSRVEETLSYFFSTISPCIGGITFRPGLLSRRFIWYGHPDGFFVDFAGCKLVPVEIKCVGMGRRRSTSSPSPSRLSSEWLNDDQSTLHSKKPKVEQGYGCMLSAVIQLACQMYVFGSNRGVVMQYYPASQTLIGYLISIEHDRLRQVFEEGINGTTQLMHVKQKVSKIVVGLEEEEEEGCDGSSSSSSSCVHFLFRTCRYGGQVQVSRKLLSKSPSNSLVSGIPLLNKFDFVRLQTSLHSLHLPQEKVFNSISRKNKSCHHYYEDENDYLATLSKGKEEKENFPFQDIVCSQSIYYDDDEDEDDDKYDDYNDDNEQSRIERKMKERHTLNRRRGRRRRNNKAGDGFVEGIVNNITYYPLSSEEEEDLAMDSSSSSDTEEVEEEDNRGKEGEWIKQWVLLP